MKNRACVKLKESANNAKPIPMGHQLIPRYCLAILATDRARIGLVSHQRTLQHTRTYSRNIDGLSH